MNPYEVLNVPHDADKGTILAAAARALRERVHSAKDIALAQKALLNPVKKAESILNAIDFSEVLREIVIPAPESCSVIDIGEPLDEDML